MKKFLMLLLAAVMVISGAMFLTACDDELKTITGVTFEDAEFDYDGTAKSIAVTGLPEGASVEYAGNNKIEAGEYTVTATITKEGYKALTLTAKLKIIGKFENVLLSDQEFDYDGTAKSIAVTGLPEGASVEYAGNNKIEIGEYTVTATITMEGYKTLTLTAKLKIVGTLENVRLLDQEFDYDGTAKSLSVSGLPQAADVTYTGNGQTEIGFYTVTAQVTMQGCDDLELSAQLKIYGTMTGIVFEDDTVDYDGEAKTLIAANLPDGAEAHYDESEFIEPGKYTVTGVVTKEFYRDYPLSAQLTIMGSFDAVKMPDMNVDYNGEKHILALENLPEGADAVFYIVDNEGNEEETDGLIEAGEYKIKAVLTHDCYYARTIEGTLTIDYPEIDVEMSDKTVTYNAMEHTLEIEDLPEGVQVVFYVVDSEGNEDEVQSLKKSGEYKIKAVLNREFFRETVIESIFTIRKAPLSVVINVHNKQLYDLNPTEFTYTVNGLKGDDEFEIGGGSGLFTGNLIFATTALQYSELGDYEIYAEEKPESDCYNITVREGRLEVIKYTTQLVKGGLQLTSDGRTVYDGKEVVYLGLNYFSMFAGCFNSTGGVNEDTVNLVYSSLEALASYNVKAIRFSAGFFYLGGPESNLKGWEEQWFGNMPDGTPKSEICMKTMVRIANKAASLNIGLIPSFFWTTNVIGKFGESYTQAFSDPNSKASKFLVEEYTKIWLDLFVEHEAFFMWELGNEWNLGMDVGENENTVDIDNLFRTHWSNFVAANDPYGRLIGSGDSELRTAQWHRWQSNSWAHDTMEQHKEVLRLINPSNMTSISTHRYPACDLIRIANSYGYHPEDERYRNKLIQLREWRTDPLYEAEYAAELARIVSNYDVAGGIDSYFGATNIYELVKQQMDIAKELGKSTYIGEAGIGYLFGECAMRFATEENGYKSDLEYEEMELFLTAFAKAAHMYKLPMLLFWNYDPKGQPRETPKNTLDGFLIQAGDTRYGMPIDRGSATEYSWNENFWTRGLINLDIIKKANDLYDSTDDLTQLVSKW